MGTPLAPSLVLDAVPLFVEVVVDRHAGQAEAQSDSGGHGPWTCQALSALASLRLRIFRAWFRAVAFVSSRSQFLSLCLLGFSCHSFRLPSPLSVVRFVGTCVCVVIPPKTESGMTRQMTRQSIYNECVILCFLDSYEHPSTYTYKTDPTRPTNV